MSFLSQLSWRFATKSFDTTKKVSDADLAKVLEAVRLAPTSYGLQPFHVHIISDKSVQEKLRAASYDQAQLTESSHILVFSALNDAVGRVSAYVEELSGGDSAAKEKLSGMKNMMTGALSNKSDQQQETWASRQAYIALGFGLAAAAELEIDSCPMEGFLPNEYAKILSVPEDQIPVVVLALGYRKEGPARPKFRFPESELFTKLS
ncbi:MAG: NAD(P)H-dependent oxidoreductase [Candidatus Pacebacteria bacterium]|nr:NAD(P)H-dependent oxidoreductase [bacterium]NCS96979.1 NAD(P)H-dependent oxidoreductase [Candidatus Paceibacterota bacterium]